KLHLSRVLGSDLNSIWHISSVIFLAETSPSTISHFLSYFSFAASEFDAISFANCSAPIAMAGFGPASTITHSRSSPSSFSGPAAQIPLILTLEPSDTFAQGSLSMVAQRTFLLSVALR